jgi:protocatechuate 3,4-dioxygenase beta subunit
MYPRGRNEEVPMDNDDLPVGRILSRREVLKLLGITSATLLVGCAPEASSTLEPTSAPAQTTSASTTGDVPACVVRPEMTEGPYYVDEDLNRSDVRSDPGTGEVKEGALLTLTFNVSQVSDGSCSSLEGAKVEIWHCDAEGVYSDVSDPGFNTEGEKFLRGYQVTDENGQATFVTIYPGWYSGRTVHIHFKVMRAPRTRALYSLPSFSSMTRSPTRYWPRSPTPAKGNATRSTALTGSLTSSCYSM